MFNLLKIAVISACEFFLVINEYIRLVEEGFTVPA